MTQAPEADAALAVALLRELLTRGADLVAEEAASLYHLHAIASQPRKDTKPCARTSLKTISK